MEGLRKYCTRCLEDRLETDLLCPKCGSKLSLLRCDDMTGQIVGEHCRVLERIGEGGFGVVYKGRQEHLDRIVAVKFLRKNLTSDKALVERFFLEARSAAKLRNPHTITIHDFGILPDGQLYFVMEHLEGQSLARTVRKEGRLPWKRAVRLMLQVCESLAEAHANGILHRDIKPENLHVTKDQEGEEFVKVLDFGIARVAQGDSAERITQQGMVLGTPEYVSPEYFNTGKVDERSDIYALGIVLYEMIVGKPPFTSETKAQIFVMHVNTQPTPVPAAQPQAMCPEDLNRLIMQTLSKNPDNRPQTVRQFALALSMILEQDDQCRQTQLGMSSGQPATTRWKPTIPFEKDRESAAILTTEETREGGVRPAAAGEESARPVGAPGEAEKGPSPAPSERVDRPQEARLRSKTGDLPAPAARAAESAGETPRGTSVSGVVAAAGLRRGKRLALAAAALVAAVAVVAALAVGLGGKRDDRTSDAEARGKERATKQPRAPVRPGAAVTPEADRDEAAGAKAAPEAVEKPAGTAAGSETTAAVPGEESTAAAGAKAPLVEVQVPVLDFPTPAANATHDVVSHDEGAGSGRELEAAPAAAGTLPGPPQEGKGGIQAAAGGKVGGKDTGKEGAKGHGKPGPDKGQSGKAEAQKDAGGQPANKGEESPGGQTAPAEPVKSSPSEYAPLPDNAGTPDKSKPPEYSPLPDLK